MAEAYLIANTDIHDPERYDEYRRLVPPTFAKFDGSRISQYAHLCAGTHDYRRRDMKIVSRAITIGKGVWIAADAFVGPDVTIGDRSLLAARSSAFSDLPAGHVCMGEPARPSRVWSGMGP